MKKLLKPLSLILLLTLSLCVASCTDSQASSREASTQAPENGAQFKEGKGVSLTDVMAKSINLQTAEVTEENMTPAVLLQLQTVHKGTEASGWLTAEQASSIRPGMEVDLRVAHPKAAFLKGKVSRVEKTNIIASGDFEIAVQTPTTLEAGTAVSATVRLDPSEGRTAIPKSALLATAEGSFAYAKNGEFYVRTPIKVGAISDAHVEVTEGLYAGDEVVTSPVMSLWLAELQVLRGGKACTCGH